MAKKNIYAIWGDYDDTKSSWDFATPMSDFVTALEQGVFTTASASPERADSISVFDVKAIEREYVSYHYYHSGDDNEPPRSWQPGDDLGSELDMVILAELENGMWIGVEAWNDYTGWGCQDDSAVSVGSRDDVIRHGLSDSACLKLGLPTVAGAEAKS